jgi:hypothetical protein
MTDNTKATRRSFLQGGALAAAPLAATSLCAVALADDGLQSRLSHLEAEAAIRSVHQSWLRRVNADGDSTQLPSVHRITAHHIAVPDRLQIATDAASAIGHYDCMVELDLALPPDCTLAQMAHAQGHGAVRRAERRMLRVEYHRSGAAWTIGNATLV